MKNLICAFIFLIGYSLFFFSCSSDDETPATDDMQVEDDPEPLIAVTFLNVSYGSNPQQVYDLYLPAGRTSTTTKTIILVHGGGWIGGDKADMTGIVDVIQQNHPNHAIVNINYVLASLTPPLRAAFPYQFLDLDAVIEKLTVEKEELQILPQFGMIGTSAGAHLSLMYDFVYDTDDQVKFVADIIGPTDFTDPFYTNDPNFGLILALLVDESQYPNGTNYAEAVSPVYQVDSSSSPAALFYGKNDSIVPLTNGQALDDALTDSQITHSFTIYDGGHGDDWSTADILNLNNQIGEFIETYLPID